MTILVTMLHVLVAVFLILVVLLQTGKGADLAGAFGGGGSQTAFGARGATTLLHKLTTTSAVLFMATSFTLAVLSSRGESTVVEEADAPVSTPAPEIEAGEVPPVPVGDPESVDAEESTPGDASEPEPQGDPESQ